MKRIVNCCLLVLLALGGSCKKPLEVVEAGEPPLPPEECRIVKTYHKTPATGRQKNEIVNAEIITLDDRRAVTVSLVSTTIYQYDQQGRIAETNERNAIRQGAYNLNRFSYDTKRLVIYFESGTSTSSHVYPSSDTIWLNEQGLQTYFIQDGKSLFTYNEDRQLLSQHPNRPNTHTYQNGNLIEAMFGYPTWIQQSGQWVPIDYQLRRYEYNLSRPNLPVIYQFYGNGSRNLPIKEVWEMKRSSAFPDGPVYQKTFTYVYDKQGRVKRRITHGKPLYSGWLLEDDLYGVGVTDYEYECN